MAPLLALLLYQWMKKERQVFTKRGTVTDILGDAKKTLYRYSKIPPFSKLDHQSPLTQIDAELAESNSNAFE